jgi:3-hydroxyisobutyrate dehydrogenase-like beta-hydroxyacid dehydrogenase
MPQAAKPSIGFIGLGRMGEAMAANLLQAGYRLRVYNRTRSRAQALAARGATVVSSPEEAAEPGGIVVSSLANDQALEQVAGESLARRLGAGGLHVSTSTVSPETSLRLAKQYQQHGAIYVAAPVLGRPDAAAAAKLWIMVSGAAQGRERARSILETLGQGAFEFGDDPGAANVVKLACNFMIASVMEAMAESFTLVQKNGIPRSALAELLVRTIFDCPAYRNYGKLIADEQYEPAQFALALGLKDMGLVVQTATASTMPMPLGDLVHNRFLAAVAKGRGELDWTGLAREVSEEAGMPPRKQ